MKDSIEKLKAIIQSQSDELERLRLENEQQKNKISLLDNILSAMPEHVYWMDRNNVLLGCNEQQAIDIGGATREELVGRKLTDLQPLEIANDIIAVNNKIMESREPMQLEEVFAMSDGSRAAYMSRKLPLINDKNEVIGLLGISVNITDIKRLEDARIIAEEQAYNTNIYLENILSMLPENVYWMDLESRILGCNQQTAKNLGYNSISDVIGRNVYDIAKEKCWGSDVAERFYANNQKVIKSGKSIIAEEKGLINNGKEIIWLSHKKPLFDEDGNIVGIIAVSTNIAEQKRLEEELAEAKQVAEERATTSDIYLQNIMSCLPEHIFWVDADFKVIGCNEKQAKDLGYEKPDDLIGKTVYDMAADLGWDKEFADSLYEHNCRVFTTGKHIISEDTILVGDEKRTFLTHKLPLYDKDEKIVGVLGTSTDITEHKQMAEELRQAKEKAEDSNKAKSEFIMNMSHDIRTPFSGVYAMAKCIQKKVQETEIKKELGYIIESSEKLLNFLNEILDIAKLDSGKLPIESVEFDLCCLIDSIVSVMRSQAQHKGIKIVLDCVDNIPRLIIGDKKRVHRILLNLISNAMKFTEVGSVTIKVKILQQTKDNIKLQIAIIDTGIGIPKDKHAFIFESFSRITSSYKGVHEGIGLGLYVVKKFLQDIDGKIKVESEVGKGSSFICTIDFALPKQQAEISHDEQAVVDKSQGTEQSEQSDKGLKFLLVEDDKLSQLVVQSLLKDLNCAVDVAANASEALELIKNPYDLIIMDIGLPDKDGITLSREIREDYNIKVPIVAVTAHITDVYREKCLEAGIDEVMMKPVSEEMMKKIKSLALHSADFLCIVRMQGCGVEQSGSSSGS